MPPRRMVGVLALTWTLGATGTSAGGPASGPVDPDRGRDVVDSLPTPVLLVPGWGDPEAALASLQARFIQAGWPPGRVAAMGFEDPVGSNRAHASELAAELRALRRATGVEEVDVVAHSMGGLALRYHLAATGGEGVRRVVFLATPHRGTLSAHLAWGAGGEEMEPGSDFLDSLNALPPVPEDVRALSVRTVLDLRVVPGESAALPGADNVRNVEVCCPTHPGLIEDVQTFRVVADFLRERDEGVPPPSPANRRREAGRTSGRPRGGGVP